METSNYTLGFNTAYYGDGNDHISETPDVSQQLYTFVENGGCIRSSPHQPDIPVGCMILPPTTLLNYPFTSYLVSPVDVIVESGIQIDAPTMARMHRGIVINETRYIFPQDGVILGARGFTDTLHLGQKTISTLSAAYDKPAEGWDNADKRSWTERWIGRRSIANLNKLLGPPVNIDALQALRLHNARKLIKEAQLSKPSEQPAE